MRRRRIIIIMKKRRRRDGKVSSVIRAEGQGSI